MRKTSIGGQALLEGLLMIGPKNIAIAVRKPDGEITIEKRPLPKKGIISKIPIIRGAVGLFRQMVIGIKGLMFSAEFFDIESEEEQPSKFDMFIEKLFGDKLKDVVIYFSVVVSLIFSVGLFIVLPNLATSFLDINRELWSGKVLSNIIEGLIRIGLFFSYLFFASKLKEMKRVWGYHGAEHKTIHCYENEEEMNVENIKKYSTRHPRCGTSFLFFVMVVSILVFSFIPFEERWINVLSRLVLIPLVAGLSYEIIKFAGRSELKIFKFVSIPGLLFQKFTTSEPDDKQIEVALEAFNSVVVEDKEADKW